MVDVDMYYNDKQGRVYLCLGAGLRICCTPCDAQSLSCRSCYIANLPAVTESHRRLHLAESCRRRVGNSNCGFDIHHPRPLGAVPQQFRSGYCKSVKKSKVCVSPESSLGRGAPHLLHSVRRAKFKLPQLLHRQSPGRCSKPPPPPPPLCWKPPPPLCWKPPPPPPR